jgi:3-phosphoshikimate 1-carboxyvinyltransferase
MGDKLPVDISPAYLMPADITPNVVSAQVKSAILLAALGTKGTTLCAKKFLTRDHSENMLSYLGRAISTAMTARRLSCGDAVKPARRKLRALDRCAGRPQSSAAFPIMAPLHLCRARHVVLENIMLNRQRDGLDPSIARDGRRYHCFK